MTTADLQTINHLGI